MQKNEPPHSPESVAKDPILGLIQVFKADSRKEKIDLLAGVLKKEGQVSLFESVKEAQTLFLAEQKHKNYLPIRGDVEATSSLGSLIWENIPKVQIQTLGGTGALSLACKAAFAMGYQRAIVSQPSWPNHARIVQQAGLLLETYVHEESKAFESLIECLKTKKEPCVIVLQPLCHNPTGIDFDLQQWEKIFEICQKQRHLVLFDVAYMGFKWSLEQDGAFIKKVTAACPNWFLSFSCAKNMTLYGERLGVLFGSLLPDIDSLKVQEYLCHLARATYSNPSMHGVGIAKTLLTHNGLKSKWIKELQQSNKLLNAQRSLLAESFRSAGFEKWAYSVKKQSGLFGYFPLSCEKANLLKEACALYLPHEGRVNLTSLDALICEKLIAGLKLVGVGE